MVWFSAYEAPLRWDSEVTLAFYDKGTQLQVLPRLCWPTGCDSIQVQRLLPLQIQKLRSFSVSGLPTLMCKTLHLLPIANIPGLSTLPISAGPLLLPAGCTLAAVGVRESHNKCTLICDYTLPSLGRVPMN